MNSPFLIFPSLRSLRSLGLCALIAIAGCSGVEQTLPGEFLGALTRTDGATHRVPNGPDTATVTRTSGSTTFASQRVSVAHTGEAGGKPRFRVSFGEGCQATVVANPPNLVMETDDDDRCVCPVDGEAVEGPVTLTGSFDADERDLEFSASVRLGGPRYGGGCTYTFLGTQSSNP